MKFLITCQHCEKMSDISEGHIHINFSTGEIYCVCPQCKKDNKLKFEPKPVNFPKIKTLGRM